jgi:hypothetical protein
MYVSGHYQLPFVQFGFSLAATFALTWLTSHHHLPVRRRRVDPHAKFLFNPSRSQGLPNAFMVRMPSHAMALIIPFTSNQWLRFALSLLS